ncbi:MAG: phosphotransferase [Bacteroidales bacterium]|nr:phosphotransferase [Bacteroidales bacterium]
MLKSLFESWANEPCTEQMALSANGSNRRYFRLRGSSRQCVAAINDDVRENQAFIYLSQFFISRQLPVPEVFMVSHDGTAYLQQDLGDTTLYDFAYDKKRQGLGFDAELVQLYKQVLNDLIRFQTLGEGLDYKFCYPRGNFDRQSMQWDLNYFKYYFLKLAHIPFDEQLLEDDFQNFMDYLLQEDCSYFMYRDFQSRNIMLQPDRSLFYIDFQGGRRGAAQYDVASLIYSAKSDIPEPIRQELLSHYVSNMAPHLQAHGVSEADFRTRFYGYVLLRIMQAMGAYGYRGYYERKDYFLKSIPLAVANLRRVVESHSLPVSLPHLFSVWRAIIDSPVASAYTDSTSGRLMVTVNSFSYKQGLPQDLSGNGGGYVFDCRALPNPGRYPEYRCYTGRDLPVRQFLQQEPAVLQFLDHAQRLVFQSIDKYMERQFSHLMISFGCTGGQHRSVYCAEQMAERIRKAFDCDVSLHHIEQEKIKNSERGFCN